MYASSCAIPLLCAVLVSLVGCRRGAPVTSECTAVQINYHGAEAYRLSNGILTVVAVPGLGGRVMSFSLAGRELFFANHDELAAGPPWQVEGRWRNWGGYKMWPAPQARWGGPPDPPGGVLDGGAYSAHVEVEPEGRWSAVTMVSERDEVTGLRFERSLRLEVGSSSALLSQRMANVSEDSVEWSIWDVTQVPGRGAPGEPAWVYFQLEGDGGDPGYVLQAGEPDNPTWVPGVAQGVMGVKYTGRVGKIGEMSRGNWMAFRSGDLVYAKLFPQASPEEVYPDGGVNVEVWSNPDPSYMEMEILGPLTTLAPGEAADHEQRWLAAVVSRAPVVAVSAEAIACGPLERATQGDGVAISGAVGVVRQTTVFVLATDNSGKWVVLARQAASPEEPADLSRLILPPEVELGRGPVSTADVMLTLCTGTEGGYTLLAVIGPSDPGQ